MIGGLILAAGGAERFGGPKQVADLDGRALVAHAAEAMLDTPAIDRVVVTVGARSEEVAEPLADLDVEVLAVGGWSEGIAASLRAGVGHLHDSDKVVVTLADEPFITSSIITMVVDTANGAHSARATYDGRPGHPVVIDKSLYQAVSALRGDDGAREVLESANALPVECGDTVAAFDVDTPEDLERARRLHAAGMESNS